MTLKVWVKVKDCCRDRVKPVSPPTISLCGGYKKVRILTWPLRNRNSIFLTIFLVLRNGLKEPGWRFCGAWQKVNYTWNGLKCMLLTGLASIKWAVCPETVWPMRDQEIVGFSGAWQKIIVSWGLHKEDIGQIWVKCNPIRGLSNKVAKTLSPKRDQFMMGI